MLGLQLLLQSIQLLREIVTPGNSYSGKLHVPLARTPCTYPPHVPPFIRWIVGRFALDCTYLLRVLVDVARTPFAYPTASGYPAFQALKWFRGKQDS